MFYSKKLTKGLKSFFLVMLAVLQLPLNFSLSMLFSRDQYSSVSNVIGFFSLFLTIPYTLVIGLPVGIPGLLLGAVLAPLAYLVAVVMDGVAWLFSGKSKKEYVIYDPLSEVRDTTYDLNPTQETEKSSKIVSNDEDALIVEEESSSEEEMPLENVIILGTKASIAYKEGLDYYDFMKKNMDAFNAKVDPTFNNFKDPNAYTEEANNYRQKAIPLFIEACVKFNQVIPSLKAKNYGFFASVIDSAQESLNDCKAKLTELKK